MNFESTSLFNLPDGNIESFDFSNVLNPISLASPEYELPQLETHYFRTIRNVFKAV